MYRVNLFAGQFFFWFPSPSVFVFVSVFLSDWLSSLTLCFVPFFHFVCLSIPVFLACWGPFYVLVFLHFLTLCYSKLFFLHVASLFWGAVAVSTYSTLVQFVYWCLQILSVFIRQRLGFALLLFLIFCRFSFIFLPSYISNFLHFKPKIHAGVWCIMVCSHWVMVSFPLRIPRSAILPTISHGSTPNHRDIYQSQTPKPTTPLPV